MTWNTFLTFQAKLLQMYCRRTNRFDKYLKKMDIIQMSPGYCESELKVEEEHVDSCGNLAQGLSSLLLDDTTFIALLTLHPFKGLKHVSVFFHMSQFDTVAVNETISIKANIVMIFNDFCYAQVEIYNKHTEEMVFRGSQVMKKV